MFYLKIVYLSIKSLYLLVSKTDENKNKTIESIPFGF